MKLISYRTGELTGTKTPLDSYCFKYRPILNCFGITGENWMFRPVNLNRAGTKKKKKKPKNHLFLSSQPFTTTLPVTPMSPATSILSIAVSPPASASSSLSLHFSVLCFSSTFQLLCSLVFLVLNAWYILFWTR